MTHFFNTNPRRRGVKNGGVAALSLVVVASSSIEINTPRAGTVEDPAPVARLAPAEQPAAIDSCVKVARGIFAWLDVDESAIIPLEDNPKRWEALVLLESSNLIISCAPRRAS